MHGMGDHGVHSADHVEARRTVNVAAAGAHADSGHAGAVTDTIIDNRADAGTVPASRPLLQTPAPIPDPVSGGGVLGLCLTLLSAVLVVWLLRLAGREPAASVLTAAVPVRARAASPARARGPSPPRRSRLCIWRC